MVGLINVLGQKNSDVAKVNVALRISGTVVIIMTIIVAESTVERVVTLDLGRDA